MKFHITPGVPLDSLLPHKFLVELVEAAGGTVQPSSEKRWSVSRIRESQKLNYVGLPALLCHITHSDHSC